MTQSQKFAITASVFIGLWLLGLALPFLGWHFFDLRVGCAVGFLVPILWIVTMPCTCMDGGGLGGSLLALVQVLSGVIWAVVGIILGFVLSPKRLTSFAHNSRLSSSAI